MLRIDWRRAKTKAGRLLKKLIAKIQEEDDSGLDMDFYEILTISIPPL